MTTRFWQPSLLAASILLAGPAFAGELRNANAPGVMPGRYIVVFNQAEMGTSSVAAFNTLTNQLGSRFGAQVERNFHHALKASVMAMTHEQAERMARDPKVAYIEPEIMMRAVASQSNATWGLDRIDQASLPLNKTYNYSSDGTGVNAYVIDTGIAPHNDFGSRLKAGFGAINDGKGSVDCNGHGTHVAGTVGGTTWGVAKNVSLYPVRVLNCEGSGSNVGVIAGIDWVVQNHRKPAVANMSLGGTASSTVDQAIARMTAAGVTAVVAGGNDSDDACRYSPARAPSAITVGSTDSGDRMSNFSNYGSCTDIYAPGSNITSTWIGGSTATKSISGTSMASPHVAGVAALYLQRNPNATPAQVTSGLLALAVANKVSGIPSGVNKLLQNNVAGGGGGGGDDTTPAPGELQNGKPVANLSGADGDKKTFTVKVPSGAKNLLIKTSGSNGDADLYLKLGQSLAPSDYDCRSAGSTSTEQCLLEAPKAGTYQILLHGYSAYSGLSLVASWEGNGGGGGGSTGGENNSPVAIPDNASAGVLSPIAISASRSVASVSVDVDISHTWIGDLQVELLAPNGQAFMLHNRAGGSADDLVKRFEVNVGSVSAAGTWNLRVKDRSGSDVGRLNRWKLTLN